MIKSCTQSERSVVVLDVVLVVVVAVADGDHSGHDHGHVYVHDLPRLSRDWDLLPGAGQPPEPQVMVGP